MITDIELLSYIREAAQMGHDGIDTVLNYSPCTPLTDALRQQKAEYGELCSSATELLKARGSDPEPLPIGAKMGLMMSRARNAMSPPLLLQNCRDDDHRQYQGRHSVHSAPPAVSGEG